MDLSSLEPTKETTTIRVVDIRTNLEIYVDEKKTIPMVVELHGTYSKRYRRINDMQMNARIKRNRGGQRITTTVEEMEADRLALCIGCIESWNIVLDGVTPPVTEESIKTVFNRLPWLRTQIDAGLEDAQAFLTP